jgi:hypothetical protein
MQNKVRFVGLDNRLTIRSLARALSLTILAGAAHERATT